MNHLKQIAAKLPEYGVDAMLLTSEPGEFYAVGFHGEGVVVVTAGECFYFTDSRYIEAANHLITGASISMTDRSRNYRAMVPGGGGSVRRQTDGIRGGVFVRCLLSDLEGGRYP